jgi:asparagine synthase (glutamine-hydrolysing)
MAEEASGPVPTFTVGFEGAGAYDERPAARRVAERFGCEHHEAVADRSLLALLPRLVAAFDEPFADSSAIPTYLVSRLASDRLPVVLSGDGGDELFCGYDWYRYHQLLRPLALFPAALRSALARRALTSLPDAGRAIGTVARARRLLADAGIDERSRYLRRITCFGDESRTRLLADPVPGSGAAIEWYERLDGAAGPPERMAYADLALGLADDMLTKVDRCSMASSLEVRVPLLDSELAAFVWSLPTALKLRGLETKGLLRRAVRDLLPPATLRRRKQGFGVPIGRWLRDDPESWRTLLVDSRAGADGYLDGSAVRALTNRHLAGREDLGHQVWALLVLEVWFRLHSEGGETRGAHAPVLSEVA